MIGAAHTLARRYDPATSHAAATGAAKRSDAQHALILDCLRTHGAMGKSEIGQRLGLDPVAISRRLPEMQRLGRAAPNGNTVLSSNGCKERVWHAI